MNYEDYVKELFSVMEVTRKINHKYFHNSDNKGPITLSESMMLCCINDYVKKQKENGQVLLGLKASEISKQLKTTKPATSKMLNILEEKGYIERINNKVDRRAVYVNITKEGVLVLEKQKNNNLKLFTKILQRIGEDDIKNIIMLMKKMNSIMEEVYSEELK